MKQDKHAEIEFFDEAGDRGAYDVITESGYQRILRELPELLRVTASLRVVDLGCGTGSFTERLSRIFPQVIGMDISPKCIAYASARYPHIRFETGDLEALPYEDDSFDLVTMFGVLHHFSYLQDPLREPFRILKKTGILFTYDPNINNPFFWIYHSENSPFYSAKTMTRNEKLFTKKKLADAMDRSGFHIERLSSISGVTLHPRHSKHAAHARPFIYIYNLAERLLDFSAYNKFFGSSIVCVARKGIISKICNS